MFWEIDHLSTTQARLYDVSSRRTLTYGDLLSLTSDWEKLFRSNRKRLIALFSDNSITSIAVYLAALRTGQTLMLNTSTSDPSLAHTLCSLYKPDIVINAGHAPLVTNGYTATTSPSSDMFVATAPQPCDEAIFVDTAVLLSTSGTTGSPKLIRLSYSNLQANAEAIAQYLAITNVETPVTSLPLSYSYGLSVVNSHLHAGANMLCTNSSLMTKDFWDQFKEHRCSSFAGVPFSYAMLERLRFDQMTLPSLRTLTQAGGRLAPEKIRLFADIAKRKEYRFFVMYGQTEATARISYVPSDRLMDKIGSIGIPIPGGHLELHQNGHTITDPHQEGELVYAGPNVMLGYADSRMSLAQGDEQHGILYTGDLGHRDADGYFYVTGRLKRFLKVFGLRLNLDDVEKMLESALGRSIACAGTDDILHVMVESPSDHDAQEALKRVVSLYKLHYSAVDVRRIDALPVTSSGKKDYNAIRSQLG